MADSTSRNIAGRGEGPARPVDADPAAVARTAFDALERRDWRALLAVVDPAALPGVKRQAIDVAERVAIRPPSTPEEIQRQQPGLPPAVAEWYADQERRALAAEEPAGPAALGVTSIDELRALPADEVFVRWMAATDVAARTRRLYAQQPAASPAAANPDPPGIRREVVGVVSEGDRAHVVYRIAQMRGGLREVQVETLVRTDVGWRFSANGVLGESLRSYIRVGRAGS